MNERIKELLTQLGTDTSGKWISVDKTETFASILVDECVQWINDNVGLVTEEARQDLRNYIFSVDKTVRNKG